MAAFSDFAKTKIYETYMKSVNAITGVSNESNFKVFTERKINKGKMGKKSVFERF